MAVDFKDSMTKDNLMRAFAGESQARNRYTFAAAQAKEAKLHVIEAVFTYTADQEREHAEIFYKHLQQLSGSTIHVDGGYPVDISDSISDLLRRAQHNEYEEAESVYTSFGDIAKEEGFLAVAGSFHMIAQIEKFHGDRFGRFAQFMEENKLFVSEEMPPRQDSAAGRDGQLKNAARWSVSDVQTGWICLNCGYIYTGIKAPAVCPVCQHDQGYFIRLELSPFSC